jgi:hypothetical protein
LREGFIVPGRKVYRNSVGRRKKKTAKALHILLIVLLLAVLVYLGYIIAGPLFRFFKQSEEIDPQGFVPPQTITETVTTPVTKIQDNTDTQTGGTVLEPVAGKALTALTLPSAALDSAQILSGYVSEALNNGYTAVVVPLKQKGGALTYKTTAEMAVSAGIVKGTMTAAEIAAVIKESGLTPIASLNLLEDNTSFSNYRGVYKFASDSSRWYDNAVNKGGKPWISPFDKDAQEYLRFLADEVSAAGFADVIFGGLVFPPFRNSDLGYIGTSVSSPDRYNALINIWDIVSAAVTANGGTPMLEMSADSVANGTAEVCKPDKLGDITAVIKYDAAAFPTTLVIGTNETVLSDMNVPDRVIYVLGICQTKVGGMTICPYITGLNADDAAAVIDDIVELGYENYIV